MATYEAYVIMTDIKNPKFLSENARGYDLDENINHAIKFYMKEQAENFLDTKCLRDKNPIIKKLVIDYRLE